MDEPLYEKWLIHQGMEHDNERYLLNKLCQKLHQDKILRPSIGTLERVIGGIDEHLHAETYQRLSFLWQPELFNLLDNLLQTYETGKLTDHRWLCMVPTANTPKSLRQTLDKITFLKNIKVDTWDLSVIPSNRKKRLANIVRNNSNHYLQRIKPQKRYPLLVCFLRETLLDTTDSILVMYHDFWTQALSDAKKSLEAYQLGVIKSQNQAVKTLTKTVEMVVDDTIENQYLRSKIFENLSKETIQEALQVVLKITKPAYQTPVFYLLKTYARFKQFTPYLLRVLDFKVAFSKDNFGAGLDLATQLQNGTKRKLPESAPTHFITQAWQKVVIIDKMLQAPAYELCVLSVLNDRLQSGDVFVELSRKYADFNSFLIPKTRWQVASSEICLPFGGLDMVKRIDGKVFELTDLLGPLADLLSDGTQIRLEDGILVVPPLEAENLPASVKDLQEQINKRLPRVGLVEMIREVDTWVGYAKELQEELLPRNPEHDALRFAALLGNACNLTLADLARSSELDYHSLWWVANNYFSDQNLKRANDLLVNFHHRQWISSYWGDGTLSSSDGQRFATSGKIRNAQALPKYFGYGKGVTFYTHTSDQYSQYGTKVISSTERDAPHVLDEILTNETDLTIVEHTTDTHGYSDLLFAFFDLANKRFAPRLRDIKNQRLCKIKTEKENLVEIQYPQLKFTGSVNIDYLKKHADELKRVAASVLTGTVTASLLINKLQSYPRQNNLMYVLQSYGQLVKTIFICKYLLQLPLRHRINTQLNKGEQLHNLRVYLWFGGDGIIRKKQEKQQQVTARCLNLLTNIVMVWNTVYIQEILKQLQKEGYQVDEKDLEHISPAPFEHINRLGKYDFNDEIRLQENGLRALRPPVDKR
jgi:TnpA family transposase